MQHASFDKIPKNEASSKREQALNLTQIEIGGSAGIL